MDRKHFILEFYDTVWTAGDVQAVERFFSPRAELGGLAPDMALKPEDFVVFAQGLLMMIEAPRFEVVEMVEDGDLVSALMHARAVSRRDGAPVDVTGQLMLRLDGDRIVEAYNHFDMMALFMSLGMMPADSFERMLGADPLR